LTSTSQEEEEEAQPQTGAENPALFGAGGHYALFSDPDATAKLEEGACDFTLSRDALQLDSKTGAHYEFAYRDFTHVVAEDYSLRLTLGGEMSAILGGLGLAYQKFVPTLFTARNDQLAQDLLIAEGTPALVLRGQIQVGKPDGDAEPGEVRVYKTLLGLFPDGGVEPLCVRFSEVQASKSEDYSAAFEVASPEASWFDGDDGELSTTTTTTKTETRKVILSQLGPHFETLRRAFAAANSQLLQETSSLIKEAYPAISSISLLKLSRLLLDGNPVKASAISSVEPNFLRAVELQVAENREDLLKCLQYLYATGNREEAYVGVKKLVTNYLYVMIPVAGAHGLALETNEQGHATYFFRIPQAGGAAAERLALALRAINYRREPIYLRDDDLLKPQYAKYKFSIACIPALRFLRKTFVGRAKHADYESWKAEADDLLSSSLLNKA
jgi:hypothetical protein